MDTQRDDLSAWATSKGWMVADVYADPGTTATMVKGRIRFQAMIADAEAGKFDAVLLDKNDRFARNRRDAAVYKAHLSELGIRVLSRTEPGIGDPSPGGFLMDGMSDLWAAHYSLQLSDTVARAKVARVQKGLPLGDLPFGYISQGPKETPKIVPEEGEAVRRGFEHYAGGNRSMLEIADEFNDAGFRPRSKRGRTVFSKATINGMLSNPFYVGDIAYHGEVLGRGLHEPIVSRELWDAVQRARSERARKSQLYGARPTRPYLLSGVSTCSGCGSQLWANSTGHGRNNYYRCASRERGDACGNSTTSCRAEVPEGEVGGLFSRLELPPAWRERVAALVCEDGDDGVHAGHERRRLKEKIKRVRQGLLDGVFDNETAKREIRDAEAVLAALPQADSKQVQAGEALTDIVDLWPQMTPTERRDLVRLVLAKVEVDLNTGAIAGVIPKPAFAPLFRVLAEEEGGLVSVCAWRPRGDSNP